MIRQPPISPLFPYPTLFRSRRAVVAEERVGVTLAHHARARVVGLRLRRLVPSHELDFAAPQARRDLQAVEIDRSEEHTSELQSRQYLVCRHLLEKKISFNQL